VRPARLLHFALLDSADVEEPLERAHALGDAAALAELEVTVRMRATDGGRFDEVMSGRAGLAISAMEPWARHAITRCQRYATLSAAAPDSSARALVQAAETVLFALAEAGELSFTLDASTAAWRTPDQILARPSTRPFVADDHFIVVVESIERAPGAGHLVRTRGLGKFGRPDVAMRAARGEAERAADWVRQVARRGAMGEPFLPGRRLSLPSLPPLALWPRTDDGLSPAPPDEAPIYELKEGGLSLVR
jgi:hypothetical protein